MGRRRRRSARSSARPDGLRALRGTRTGRFASACVDAGNPRSLQDRHPDFQNDVQNAQPPEQVQAAFDDAVKAGQDRERQKNEGQAYANDVIPKAQARPRGCSRRRKATGSG